MPFEETADHHRFRVSVTGRGKTEVKVAESRVLLRYTAYLDLTSHALGEWLSQRLLDRTTFDELSSVLEHWELARRCDEKVTELEDERETVYAGQTRVAEQPRCSATRVRKAGYGSDRHRAGRPAGSGDGARRRDRRDRGCRRTGAGGGPGRVTAVGAG